MEAVEALYKTNPEYFIYIRIIEPVYRKSIKKLYKEFPGAIPSKCFDNFTEESFKEIENNLCTPKYPVLFITSYAGMLPGEELYTYENEDTPIFKSLLENGLSKKEYKVIIEELIRSAIFINSYHIEDSIYGRVKPDRPQGFQN